MSDIKGIEALKDEFDDGMTILDAVDLVASDVEVTTPEVDIPDALLERMADEVHQAWCEWMMYLFAKGWTLQDQGFKIDSERTKRWKRQMKTPYAQLSEKEKESERRIARRYLNIGLSEEF